jgi:hypothetical protein
LTDLEAAKLIGDPLFEFNFKNATLWSNYTWQYSTMLDLSDQFYSVAAGEEVVLVFEGIKMGATIALGGQTLGTVTDQFLRYNYTVGNLLRDADSTSAKLTVTFDGSSTNGRFMACTGGW